MVAVTPSTGQRLPAGVRQMVALLPEAQAAEDRSQSNVTRSGGVSAEGE
jgi:hypothetical protein